MSNETQLNREQTLARALRAALRWPYDDEVVAHAEGKAISADYNEDYVRDILDMREGLKLANEIGCRK